MNMHNKTEKFIT